MYVNVLMPQKFMQGPFVITKGDVMLGLLQLSGEAGAWHRSGFGFHPQHWAEKVTWKSVGREGRAGALVFESLCTATDRLPYCCWDPILC